MRGNETEAAESLRKVLLAVLLGAAIALLCSTSAANSRDLRVALSEEWQSIGPWGGSAFALALAPSETSRLYVAGRYGIFRSDDGAEHWVLPDDGSLLDTGIRALAVSPIDPDLVVAVGWFSDKIYRTTNGGGSWTSIVVGPTWSGPRSISFNPQNASTLLLTTSGSGGDCIYKSTDAGLTWFPSHAGIVTWPPGEAVYHPTRGLIALVGTPDGIYRSSNGGQSWTLVYAGGSSYSSPSLSWCAGDSSRVYAVIGGCGERLCGIPLRSDDEGLTFTEMNEPQTLPGGQVCELRLVRVHPTDPDIVFLGAILWDCVADCWSAHVYVTRSTDGGATWTTTFARTDLNYDDVYPAEILVDPADPDRVYLAIFNLAGARAEGVRRSDTGGAGDWQLRMQGIGEFAILATTVDSLGVFYARTTKNDSLYVATEAGASWVPARAPDYGWIYWPHVFEVNFGSGAIHEVGMDFVFDWSEWWWSRSTDGGASWNGRTLWDAMFNSGPTTVASNHGTGEVIYFWVNNDQEVYRSDDWGENFASVFQGFGAVSAVVDPLDPDRLFALDAGDGKVRLSEDGGVSWAARATGLPADDPVDLFMDRESPNRLLAVYAHAGVYESRDAGESWAPMPLDLGGAVIVAADWAAATDRVFLATDDARVFVRDLGFVNQGLVARGLRTITYWPQQDVLLVGTERQSVMGLSLEPFWTGVDVAPTPTAEMSVSPNPFQRETTIHFGVPPSGSFVELAVYSVGGRRVRTLLSGWRNGGGWSQRWDGRDENGTAVAPGVYFVRCALAGRSLTEQVVLLR